MPGEDPQTSLPLMFLRVSPEDRVLYANTALAAWLGIPKTTLIGMPFADLQRGVRGEMRECFQRPDRGQPMQRLVTDEAGRVFEARTTSEKGVLDITLSEVTDAEAAFGDLLRSTGTPLESLTEDEFRILRQADRRLATVTIARMQGFGAAAEHLPPHEAQLMLDAFAEETSEAILATGSTVGQMGGRAVTGIFGSPRYHRDHALRAVLSACLQIDRIAHLHDVFSKHGREMPPASIAIATGDMLLAVVETRARRACNSLGETVELAEKLARFARPGEVVLTETTLMSMLANLPSDWESIRCATESEPELIGFDWDEGSIEPPAAANRRIAWLIGPGVSTDTSCVELYVDYVFNLRDRSGGASTPILRVVRPSTSGSSIELDESNVVGASAVSFMGKYRLIEVVGEGGMGKVWRAEDRFGNTVAIKVLNSNDGATAAQLQRFRREAEIMAKLPHRNICRVLEFGEYENVNFIAMEFVNGVTLADLLYVGRTTEPVSTPLPELIRSIRSLRDIVAVTTADHAKPENKHNRILPVEQIIPIVTKICSAVQFAHEHGVLHRDLKPGNILLREDAEPLVADFGLAKLESGAQSLSVSGHVVGTVENMAPEQARSSKDVDGRADVFSIGTILYQLLTGRKYFSATGNLVADAHTLQNYAPPRPRAVNRHIDPDLEIIVLKTLRHARDDRYPTVAALQADLEHFQRGEPISARPVTTGEIVRNILVRHKSASIVAIAAAAVIAVGLVAAGWTINDRRLDAEHARELAESAQREAEKRTVEAEQARKLAEQRRTDAEKALAEAELARIAEREARGLHDEAVARAAQSEEERVKALAEQKRLTSLADEQARRLRETEKNLEELQTQAASAQTGSTANQDELRQTTSTAVASFQLAFSESAIDDLRNAQAILEQLNQFMDYATSALMRDPKFVPALLMKARLHLAAMEINAAQVTIGRAKAAVAATPKTEDARAVEALGSIVNSLRSGPGASVTDAVARLEKSRDPVDATVVNILQALQETTHGWRKAGDSFGRPVTHGEVVFSLHANNPGIALPTVENADAGGFVIAIDAGGTPVDLSALKGLDVRSLAISKAAAIDTRTLDSLPVESLDLSGCAIQTLGISPQNPGLMHVRTVNLSGTKFVDVRELALLPLLEELDLSGTKVRSLTALTGRQVRRLNITGCPISSLSALYWIPLESLVLDANTAAVMKATPQLRSHRTLRTIRTPDDSETQSAVAFWRAVDMGSYDAPEPEWPPKTP